MNHKRKKPRYQRAACMCKYYKKNQYKDKYEIQTKQEKIRIIKTKEECRELV